ncbi:helix-turn-helix domain-containing protein [Phocaeicola sp.]
METDFKKVVGERLKVLRIEKRMTQEEMGEKLNLSTSAYCKMEYGETDLTLTRLNQIAEALEITPMELFNQLEGNTYFTNCNHIGVGIAKDNSTINTINIDNGQELKELIRANSRLIEMLCKRMDELERQNR